MAESCVLGGSQCFPGGQAMLLLQSCHLLVWMGSMDMLEHSKLLQSLSGAESCCYSWSESYFADISHLLTINASFQRATTYKVEAGIDQRMIHMHNSILSFRAASCYPLGVHGHITAISQHSQLPQSSPNPPPPAPPPAPSLPLPT